MNKIDDGGSAFPYYETGDCGVREGMSLRDYFAAKAMAAMLSNPQTDGNDAGQIPETAYLMADIMLSARKSSKPEQQQPTGWVEWNGGECPVPKGSKFWIKFRDGHACDAGTGDGLVWHHDGFDGDIIAYFIYNNGDQK